jgi:hypothetical protein
MRSFRRGILPVVGFLLLAFLVEARAANTPDHPVPYGFTSSPRLAGTVALFAYVCLQAGGLLRFRNGFAVCLGV